jgi:hypothetical protein
MSGPATVAATPQLQTDLPCLSKDPTSLGRTYTSLKKYVLTRRPSEKELDDFFDGPFARAIQERESGLVNSMVRAA